jgi:hypothetical protein
MNKQIGEWNTKSKHGRPKLASYYYPDKEEIQVENIRKSLNMPPIKIGFRDCLCCGNNFKSMDLKNMKTCVRCRRED